MTHQTLEDRAAAPRLPELGLPSGCKVWGLAVVEVVNWFISSHLIQFVVSLNPKLCSLESLRCENADYFHQGRRDVQINQSAACDFLMISRAWSVDLDQSDVHWPNNMYVSCMFSYHSFTSARRVETVTVWLKEEKSDSFKNQPTERHFIYSLVRSFALRSQTDRSTDISTEDRKQHEPTTVTFNEIKSMIHRLCSFNPKTEQLWR